LIADPSILISRFGFAWFGGFLAGFVVLLFLARRFGIPALEFMDLCSPQRRLVMPSGASAACCPGTATTAGHIVVLALGMAFSRRRRSYYRNLCAMGLAGRLPRLPTPIYEFFIWMAIAAFLWHMGKKSISGARPKGEILCGYLILTGVARFLIEFIRINPRSFFGLRMLRRPAWCRSSLVLFCSGGSGAVRLCNRNLLNLQSVPHIAGR